MKYLVVSDTHRQHGALEHIIKKESPIDGIIHLGDAEGCEDYIQALAGVPLEIVAGNNDFFSELPREMVLTLDGHRIFLAHGHTYRVGMGPMFLAEEAKRRDCEIALHGHTHVPCDERFQGVRVFNPGSISYPRQPSRQPSYGVLTVEKGEPIHLKHYYL